VPPSPIRTGAFVLTNFPFGPPHRRDVRGPTPHIAYCLGFRSEAAPVQLMLAYTSSAQRRWGTERVSLGVIEFDAAAAAVLSQRPFHIDLRCLARVALSAAWFPRLDRTDRGVVAWADRVLQTRVTEVLFELARRSPGHIEIRGIGSER